MTGIFLSSSGLKIVSCSHWLIEFKPKAMRALSHGWPRPPGDRAIVASVICITGD
jgi:hypothetical protein